MILTRMEMKLLELRSLVRRVVSEAARADGYDFTQAYPADHQLGMRVPKGGSSCAKCRWVSEDGERCGNDAFREWNEHVNGASEPAKLPAPADSYCCDLFQAAK